MRVSVQGYEPQSGQDTFINLACHRLMRGDPALEVTPYATVFIQGGPGAEATRYMAHAGGTAPDVITYLIFHDVRTHIRHGFYLPLNEFIGEDRDGDGFVGDDEAVWPEWRRIPEFYRRVATVDGRIYALPWSVTSRAALVYRRDLLRAEGIDPDTPPADFEALYRVLQALTRPARDGAAVAAPRGRTGIALDPRGWMFCAWVWAAGGELTLQERTNPRTFRTHAFVQEETRFRDPETGEDLSRQPGRWRAAFAGEGGQRALEFYRRMRWSKWVRDPQTGAPADLSEAEAAAGAASLPDGRTIRFAPRDVIEGVCRVNWAGAPQSAGELLRRGEVAMIYASCDAGQLQALDIPPDNLGMWPVPPAAAGGRPGMLAQNHFGALNATLAGERNRRKREKAWEILSALNGPVGARWQTEHQVRMGQARFLDPDLLRRHGMTEHLDLIPEHWLRDWSRALAFARTEPFEGFWPPIKTKILDKDVLSLALTQRVFDARAALARAEREANAGIMFPRAEDSMRRCRAWAWAGVAALALVTAGLMAAAVRSAPAGPRQGDVLRRRGPLGAAWAPVLMLAPALLLIAVWQYYPLLRGGAMAFQDCRIAGPPQWIGADNFVNVFFDPNFLLYLRKTAKYVCLVLLLGFTTPVALALLLTETPRFKVLFRTLFFLPQVSSGLVVVFLWKLFYDPTPNGFLNRLLGLARPVDWLGDPRFAMLAVILPGVWAGAGIGSLVYQAALRSVPPDVYEAATVDGAGVRQKLRHITLPCLLPLLIINFVGVFIGTFHAMGNIFAMTAGGPGNETMVMSLAIWYEAFAFLRFGTATAMAWVLGAILIGFTVMQLRLLRRVEFRRAEA